MNLTSSRPTWKSSGTFDRPRVDLPNRGNLDGGPANALTIEPDLYFSDAVAPRFFSPPHQTFPVPSDSPLPASSPILITFPVILLHPPATPSDLRHPPFVHATGLSPLLELSNDALYDDPLPPPLRSSSLATPLCNSLTTFPFPPSPSYRYRSSQISFVASPRYPSSVIRHPPSAVHRSPFPVSRAPLIVRHFLCAICRWTFLATCLPSMGKTVHVPSLRIVRRANLFCFVSDRLRLAGLSCEGVREFPYPPGTFPLASQRLAPRVPLNRHNNVPPR